MPLSIRLWIALRNPPRHHPLFRYTLAEAKREEPRVTSGFFMWAFMCSTVTFLSTVILTWIPLLLLLSFLLANTLYGLRWALRISYVLMQEKIHNRYDLLAALPPGRLGTAWAISTGCLHRRFSFRWVPFLVATTTLIFTFTLVVTSGITWLVLQQSSMSDALRIANSHILYLNLLALPVFLLFYVDHQYAMLTGVLLALVATVDQKIIPEVRTRVLLIFFTLQSLIYIGVFGAAVTVPTFIDGADVIKILAQITIGAALFFILREVVIRYLWHLVQKNFHAEEAEIELVLQPAPARGHMA